MFIPWQQFSVDKKKSFKMIKVLIWIKYFECQFNYILSLMALPGCLSGLQLHFSTVTVDPCHYLFYCPLSGGLKVDKVKFSWILNRTEFIYLFIFKFRFKGLPDSFEIVLEVEKSPLPEMQPHFSFWTFGHLSSLCGALRWPPLSGGEAPTTPKERHVKESHTIATTSHW